MRFAVDTGGTFTDLIVEDDGGRLGMFKASTTPDDPIRGVIDCLKLAAGARDVSLADLLGRGSHFIHGTTHAINAVITGNTARTAFLTTKGHPDVLTLREGGRMEPFNFTVPFPDPYVPRSLTFEVGGRIAAGGSELEPLDETALAEVIEKLRGAEVEAVAVCLLWSILKPDHELRVREAIGRALPDVAVTLSHEINPAIREYRRASSSAIDASLKPTMSAYMGNLQQRLKEEGYSGRVLIVTSQGGVVDAGHAARAPIHLINSGPSMAPVAGIYYAAHAAGSKNAIVADTGGTTYDVSLIRDGSIPWTRETWIGEPHRGHMTGFPSVDVKSIGAGGGSIAWIDSGGMLHVGPKSAGAAPGPVCYGRGGDRATVTDAALVLGYIDPDFFLGGQMALDGGAARQAIADQLAGPLNLSIEAAADAILRVATENMVQAIIGITVNQGIDPADSVLIGGGGAAGLNSAWIGQRLGCAQVIVPQLGAALSAAGALMSDLTSTYSQTQFVTSSAFDRDAANRTLDELQARCRAFIREAGEEVLDSHIQYSFEGRYPSQVWEIEVPLSVTRFEGEDDLTRTITAFHAAHREVFAIDDRHAPVEIVSWNARVSCRLRADTAMTLDAAAVSESAIEATRQCYFHGSGWLEAPVQRFETLAVGRVIEGPAIIESSFTTVVVPPATTLTRTEDGSVVLDTGVERLRRSA